MSDAVTNSGPPRSSDTVEIAPTSAQLMLQRLLAASIVVEEDWERLAAVEREILLKCTDPEQLLPLLTRHGLLTTYQADRVAAGNAADLVLGHYRILERLGSGGTSVVYKAEQLALRREVAIKVLSASSTSTPRGPSRFTAEVRAVARLQHPNIVAAIDAGVRRGDDLSGLPLRYFVMEYIPGQDLDQLVGKDGPLPLGRACDLIHQIAAALEKAHEHNLVHRDIKPSNIRVTPDGQAKLVDFGLARQVENRQTLPGALLGTLDFMAPEQAKDAGSVDIRADIFALGGTLFWCLTGKLPFPAQGTLFETMSRRMTRPPPSARTFRPDLPPEIDAVLARMMAIQPSDRYPTPRAVMRALVPFLRTEPPVIPAASPADSALTGAKTFHVLIVDDNTQVREFSRHVLQADDIRCDEVGSGAECLDAFRTKSYDLVLLDIDMPGMSGPQVLRHLRHDPPVPRLKVVMFSGRASPDEMAQVMLDGADDYLTKPFSSIQLQARVRAALRLKTAQVRSDDLNRHLMEANRDLEANLAARARDVSAARNILTGALSGVVALRSAETAGHLQRIRRFSRKLAEVAAGSAAFAGQVDATFIDLLECCAPLHDLGTVGLPEHIVLKPGPLTQLDRVLIQSHTTLGADLVRDVARGYEFVADLVEMMIAIIRHHHERYDGQGYPGRLAGAAIPLAARIVHIVDVYDALRSRRIYKPPLPHGVAMEVMCEQSAGQFDPDLLALFRECAADIDAIFCSIPD